MIPRDLIDRLERLRSALLDALPGLLDALQTERALRGLEDLGQMLLDTYPDRSPQGKTGYYLLRNVGLFREQKLASRERRQRLGALHQMVENLSLVHRIAPDAATGQEVRDGARKGGFARRDKAREKARERERICQAMADEIRDAHPGWSKTAIARLVRRRLPAEEKVTLDWIRRHIAHL